MSFSCGAIPRRRSIAIAAWTSEPGARLSLPTLNGNRLIETLERLPSAVRASSVRATSCGVANASTTDAASLIEEQMQSAHCRSSIDLEGKKLLSDKRGQRK